MSIAFRPFDLEHDFASMAELWTKDNPDWLMTEAECRMIEHHQYRDKPLQRWVGEENGRVVCMYGFGDQPWAHKDGRKYLSWHVDPEVGDSAFRAVLEQAWERAREQGCAELNIWTRDSKPDRMATLNRLGGRVDEKLPHSRLDLRSFDPESHSVTTASARVESFEDLDRQGYDWKPVMYEVSWEIVCDIPASQEPTKPPYETYLEWVRDERIYDRKLMFAAFVGEEMVAYTRLQKSESDPKMLFTGLTGVARAHRRKGLATQIKVHALEKMKALGYEVIQTDNLEHNPMYQINLKLGFKPFCTYLHYVFNGPFGAEQVQKSLEPLGTGRSG